MPETLRSMDTEPAPLAVRPGRHVGVKFDQGKARYELIPPEMDRAMAEILTSGAAKYGDRNWEAGLAYGRVYGALRRHQEAWWAGEEKDPETGKSHLWHAACCLAFLVTYEARGLGALGFDDRSMGAS